MHLHTAHIYCDIETPEVGTVLGLLSKNIDNETAFDKFKGNRKGYVERNFGNEKDVIFVVTDMEDPMEYFEEYNVPKYL